MARKRIQSDLNAQRKGRWIDLPEWFLQEMSRVAGDANAQDVADRILVKTKQRWTRTVIGDFLNNRRATIEIAEAFCDTYDVPRIVWFAESLSEALAFRRESAKRGVGDPVARSDYDKALEQLEKQVDQTSLVTSKDEVGIGRGGRTRRVGDRRS